MKRFAALALVAGLTATTALASDLNLTVREAGTGLSVVNAAPGATVNYEVVGTLSDNANLGLALFGFTLSFDGGDLTAADVPVSVEMINFDRPDGITNPGAPDALECPPACGFGGTLIAGDLVQIGGGQNTILNTIDNAPFPVGAVMTNLGHTELVLATGSLVMPGVGPYTLTIPADSVFANVIRQGETGVPFWAVDAAGVGTITPLTLTGAPPECVLTSSVYPCDGSLTRSQGHVLRFGFDCTLPGAPAAGEVEIRMINPNGSLGGDLSGSFSATVEGGNTLRLAETGQVLVDETWYAILNTGGWAGVGNFEMNYVVCRGDADDGGFTNFADLSMINANMSDPAADDDRFDIDAGGFVNFADISAANNFIGSTAPAKPAGHSCTLP